MADFIEYYIDGKLYQTDKSVLSVAEIIAKIGFSDDEYHLISSDDNRYLDSSQNVEIHQGDHFKTEKRNNDSKSIIFYKVNGEQLSTAKFSLSVEEILRAAGKASSVDLQQLDSYFLENIKTGLIYENLADVVKLMSNDQFLAFHIGATPVANFQMS